MSNFADGPLNDAFWSLIRRPGFIVATAFFSFGWSGSMKKSSTPQLEAAERPYMSCPQLLHCRDGVFSAQSTERSSEDVIDARWVSTGAILGQQIVLCINPFVILEPDIEECSDDPAVRQAIP